MMTMLKTHTGRLRITAFLEGLSFILLVGIAVPMKYLMNIKEATMVIGMIHGALFMLYVLLVFPVREEQSWNLKTTGFALLASILPFGTFVFDSKVLKKIS